MPYKQFTPDVLSSAEVNTYLMNQSVIVFANAAARTAALGASPPEGMVTYLQDLDAIQIYDGASWGGGSFIGSGVEATEIQTESLVVTSGSFFQSDVEIDAGLQVAGSATIDGGLQTLTYFISSDVATFEADATFDANVEISNGTLTVPNQPAFQAYGPVASPASGTFPVRLLNTYLNRGSVYNTATGYFTAPVAGVYLFSWSFLTINNNDVFRWFLRKNGATIGDLHLRADTLATGSEFATNASKTWIIQLIAGDTIAIYYAADAGTAFYNAGGNEYSTFGGYLIG